MGVSGDAAPEPPDSDQSLDRGRPARAWCRPAPLRILNPKPEMAEKTKRPRPDVAGRGRLALARFGRGLVGVSLHPRGLAGDPGVPSAILTDSGGGSLGSPIPGTDQPLKCGSRLSSGGRLGRTEVDPAITELGHPALRPPDPPRRRDDAAEGQLVPSESDERRKRQKRGDTEGELLEQNHVKASRRMRTDRCCHDAPDNQAGSYDQQVGEHPEERTHEQVGPSRESGNRPSPE